MQPAKGLKLIGTSGLRAKVTNVTKTKITVEVERKVRTRGGESKIEKRVREVPPDLWPNFVTGYKAE